MGGYISLHNISTAFSDTELANTLPDLQSQVSYLGEFWWHWGLSASLDINGNGTPIVIVDYPGPNGPTDCLGYHYIDGNYQPYAVIYAGLCRDRGKSTTGVISHELLEMLADQQTNSLNLIDNGDNTGIIVTQEVCDPCEESLYYLGPNGGLVSDFVLPGWWVPGYQFQVDFLGLIPGPLRVASGGYISYRTVTMSGPEPSVGDQAGRDMNKVVDATRNEVAAAYSSRLDVLGQLHASRGLWNVPSAVADAGAGWGRSVPTIPKPRQQPATREADIKVVARENIPRFGQGVPPER